MQLSFSTQAKNTKSTISKIPYTRCTVGLQERKVLCQLGNIGTKTRHRLARFFADGWKKFRRDWVCLVRSAFTRTFPWGTGANGTSTVRDQGRRRSRYKNRNMTHQEGENHSNISMKYGPTITYCQFSWLWCAVEQRMFHSVPINVYILWICFHTHEDTQK